MNKGSLFFEIDVHPSLETRIESRFGVERLVILFPLPLKSLQLNTFVHFLLFFTVLLPRRCRLLWPPEVPIHLNRRVT